jgi:hypothetical protein
MNSYSEWAPVTSGIPQGSVLEAILFVIYINDLPDYLKSECYMFADDTDLWKKQSATKIINILTLVLSEKKILNETKNHNTPPPFAS